MKNLMKWMAITGCLALAACGDPDGKSNNGSDNGDPNGNPNGQSGASCSEMCSNLETACPMALEGATSQQCEANCATLTSSQINCLASVSDCNDAIVCDQAPDNSTANNQQNNANNANNQPGNNCPAPTCEGNVAVQCDDSGGFASTVRTTCSAGCDDGECVVGADLCEPFIEEDNEGCPEFCDASDSITINGNSFCTSRCGPNDECPEGLECNREFNGGTCQYPCTNSGLDCPEGFLERLSGTCADEWCG